MLPTHVISPPALWWNICVMTRGETYFANTEGTIKGYGVMLPGSLYDVGVLLRDVGNAFTDQAEGLLLVPAMPGAGDIDESLPETESLAWRWSRMEAAAMQAGWSLTGDAARTRETGWATFKNVDTGRKIYMGVLSMMDQDRTPLFDLGADAETITQRLVSYASVTGVLWRMTAGVSGCASLRADRAERAARQLTIAERLESPDDGQPHWRWDAAPNDVHGAGHMIWSRPLTSAERGGHVVTYDIRAQFLAAMVSGNYGWGEPSHKARPTFNPDRGGFWLISASGLQSLQGPPIIRHKDGRGLTWVTTPVMVYLQGKGIEPMVYESWTSATSSQWLKPWATKVRDALYAESEYLRDIEPALKRTYAEMNGMFNVPGGSVFRRDIHWTTVDTGTMNLRRKLDQVHKTLGIWPCGIYHDAVSFPVADYSGWLELNTVLGITNPPPTSPRIGKFKWVSRMDAGQWDAKQGKKSEVHA